MNIDYTEKRKEEIGKIIHDIKIMDGHKRIHGDYDFKMYSIIAALNEFGRHTDALNRIADALEEQNEKKQK